MGIYHIPILAPCRQDSCNQPLWRSIPSGCLNAGNLIMAAVIYSSHGSYLAPANPMGTAEGESAGQNKDNNCVCAFVCLVRLSQSFAPEENNSTNEPFTVSWHFVDRLYIWCKDYTRAFCPDSTAFFVSFIWATIKVITAGKAFWQAAGHRV